MNPAMYTAEEEIAVIDAFVLKERRERLRSLVANPRRHSQFLEAQTEVSRMFAGCPEAMIDHQ